MSERVKIVVDNRLRINEADIPPWVQQQIFNQFTHRNPKHEKLRAMGYYAAQEPQLIRTYRVEDGIISLPRGGTQRLRETLRSHGISWEFVDESSDGVDFGSWSIPDHKVKLYDYQEEATASAIAKRNCIIRAPTGSGKTTIGIAIISRLKLPALVIVWSRALMSQWLVRFEKELGLKASDIGVIGAGKMQLAPITIGMQQSIYRRVEEGSDVAGRFGVVIPDELQRFAAPTFQGSIEPFSARYRIGISADETRADGKEFLIYDVFGTHASNIQHDSLVDDGFIMDVEIRVIPTDLDAVDYLGSNQPDFNALLDLMTTDDARNELIGRVVRYSFRNSGNNALVFSHRIAHCQRIDSECVANGLRSGLMLGSVEWSRRFTETVKGLGDGTIQVGVGTIQAIGQGIDIPRVDCGIIATPIPRNRQQFGQVRGRVCRTAKGKERAVVYYLWDRKVFGVSTIKNLIQWNAGNVTVGEWRGEEIDWVPAKDYLHSLKSRTRQLFGG